MGRMREAPRGVREHPSSIPPPPSTRRWSPAKFCPERGSANPLVLHLYVVLFVVVLWVVGFFFFSPAVGFEGKHSGILVWHTGRWPRFARKR